MGNNRAFSVLYISATTEPGRCLPRWRAAEASRGRHEAWWRRGRRAKPSRRGRAKARWRATWRAAAAGMEIAGHPAEAHGGDGRSCRKAGRCGGEVAQTAAEPSRRDGRMRGPAVAWAEREGHAWAAWYGSRSSWSDGRGKAGGHAELRHTGRRDRAGWWNRRDVGTVGRNRRGWSDAVRCGSRGRR